MPIFSPKNTDYLIRQKVFLYFSVILFFSFVYFTVGYGSLQRGVYIARAASETISCNAGGSRTLTVGTYTDSDGAQFTDGADLTLSVGTGSACTFTINGAVSLASLAIQTGVTLTHSANTTTQTNTLSITTTGNITIDAGASINVDGKGYTGGSGLNPGNGPGAGVAGNGGGGGGHGGDGGDGYIGFAGGLAYCDTASPATIGSGGGGASSQSGGTGGGLVALSAGGTVTVNGTITADGMTGSTFLQNGSGGGGAGGGVHITADTIAGTPQSFTLTGGNAYVRTFTGGGGGGGCARVTYTTSASFTASSVTVTGGTGYESGSAGVATVAPLNSAPTATAIAPSQASSGSVTVTTTIADVDSDITSLIVEHSVDNSTWTSSTIAIVTPSEGSVTTSTGQISSIDTDLDGSVDLTFTWNIATDLPNTEDTTVYFRVIPNDGTVNGTTQTSSAFAIDSLAPTAPSALTVFSTSTDSVILTLPTTTSTDTNFQEYKIFYTTASSGVAVSDTAFTSSSDANLATATFNDAVTTTISGLATSTQYVMNIWAYDVYGNTTSSPTELTFYTLASVAGAPTVNNATTSTLDIAIDVNGNSVSTTFAVYNNTDTVYLDGNGTATTTAVYQATSTWGDAITATGLSLNTSYQFSVIARNGDGINTATSTPSVATFTLAAPPTGAGTTGISGSAITFLWNANGNAAGTEYYAENVTAGTNSGWTTSLSWTSLALSCGTSYNFSVKARNGDAVETTSVSTSATTSGCGGGGFIPPQNPPTEPPPTEPTEPSEPPPTEPVEPTNPTEPPPTEPTTPPVQQPPKEPVTTPKPLPKPEPTTPPTTEPTTPSEPGPTNPGTSEPTNETPTTDSGGTGTPTEPTMVTPPTTPTGGTVVTPPSEEASDVSSLMYRVDSVVNKVKESIQNITVASIRNAVNSVPEKAVAAAKQIQEFANNPEVEKANERVVAPTVAAIAVTNAAVGMGLPQVVVFLKYLFTQPLLLLRRRKQKGWGTVYNAFTKQPVDLATIRVFDSKTNNLIRSQVTDREGRYFLMLDPGEYRIEVDKSGFARGSELLHGKSEDTAFVNLYHIGQLVTVTEAQSEINLNIPLDPAGEDKPTKTIIREYTTKVIQLTISTLGLVVTVISFIISPTLLVGSLLALHIMAYVFFNILSHKKLKGSVGVVVSDDNKKEPLAKVAIRVFDAAYDKLIDTAVTDSKGRYAMLVGPSTYYVTYDKPGFEKKQSPTIDYSSEKTQGRGAMIARDERLLPSAVKKEGVPDVPLQLPIDNTSNLADTFKKE